MSLATFTRAVDVSNNVDPQDWAALYREGVRIAYARITEGRTLVDGHADNHLTGARRVGMRTGGYHFAWPNEPVDAQAAHYIANVRAHAEADPHFTHWLDLEPYEDQRNYRGMSSAEIKAFALAWCLIVARAFPHQRVGIYAGGPEWAAGHVPDEPWLAYWLPAYPYRGMTYAEAEARPRPRAGRHPALLWQFSGTPDLSVFYGTVHDYDEWSAPTLSGPVTPPVHLPVPAPRPPVGGRLRVWVVKRGQTLSLIAAAFGVSVAALASFNHIHNPDYIVPGEHITAPPSPTHHTPVSSVSPVPSPSTSRYTYPSPSVSSTRGCR